MNPSEPLDRRQTPRVDGGALWVALRVRGRLTRLAAEALDFSRHGIAVHTEVPLDKDRPVYLSLSLGELHVDNLVGVVHNCVRRDGGYRSGIRFRPSSDLQRDRLEVEALLDHLEALLQTARDERA